MLDNKNLKRINGKKKSIQLFVVGLKEENKKLLSEKGKQLFWDDFLKIAEICQELSRGLKAQKFESES